MSYLSKTRWAVTGLAAALFAAPGVALETDRQQPLDVAAASTDGALGDGVTVLRGGVEIRQGSLQITADEMEVSKQDGKVQVIVFHGTPARLEQEIEEQGLVQAEARTITYQVAAGMVELAGEADVNHPQYDISGGLLTYDLDAQHFEGSGTDTGDGRLRIRLEPEVAEDLQAPAEGPVTPDNDDGGDPGEDGG